MKYLVISTLVLAGCDSGLDFSETVPPAPTSADQASALAAVETAKDNQEKNSQTAQLSQTPPTTAASIAVTKLTLTGIIAPRQGMGIAGDAASGVIFGGGGENALLSDMSRYTVIGDAVSVEQLSSDAEGANISERIHMGIVGTATHGIICCGSLEGGEMASDFYLYMRKGNSSRVTFTALTKAGSGRNLIGRSGLGMVGNSREGLIFGGYKRGTGALDDYYHYSVSGNTITLTTLAKRGESFTPRHTFGFASTAGNITNTIVAGGRGRHVYGEFNFYRAIVSTSANTVTFTPLTEKGDSISDDLMTSNMVGDATAGVIFGKTVNLIEKWFHYSIAGNTVTITNLTNTGISFHPDLEYHGAGMVGTVNNGLLFGGMIGNNRDKSNDFYKFVR